MSRNTCDECAGPEMKHVLIDAHTLQARQRLLACAPRKRLSCFLEMGKAICAVLMASVTICR
jgi:hypothetical protein